MSFASPVTSEVDFAAEGRHAGFLRLPHSVHRSAYGWIPIPVISIRRGSGPKVVLMAGNHGDEYEGQVALTRLAQTLTPADVQGQLIVLPMANAPAARAGLRTSPIDDGNLNRSFPGNPRGTPTEIIADYLEQVVFAGIDHLLDLHSGGSSLAYLPSALIAHAPDEAGNRLRRGLLEALGLPYALVFEREDDGPFATSGASRQGGIGITTELGGAGTVAPAMLRLAEAGLARFLRHVGVCPRLPTEPALHVPRLMQVDESAHYVYARSSGLFEPLVELGEQVEAGQAAALVHTPELPWQAAQELRFERAGFVICQRVPARVEPGDCLFQLGGDVPDGFF